MKNKVCTRWDNRTKDGVLYTISDVFQKYAVEDNVNVEEVATKVYNYFISHGITKNYAGGDITYARVLSEIRNNIIRRIEHEVGSKKKSWWSAYDIIENEKCFKIVKRTVNIQPLLTKISKDSIDEQSMAVKVE